MNSSASLDLNQPKADWQNISNHLIELVGDHAYTRWFSAASIEEQSDSAIEIGVESDTHQLWIETNYLPELQEAIARACPEPLTVTLSVMNTGEVMNDEQPEKAKKKSETKVDVKGMAAKVKKSGLNPLYTFDRFVVGANNEFADAASRAVAEKIGLSYNPLFIHGASGLGKTHLMQAVGHAMINENPEAKVVYLTSEKFTNEFIDAVRKGGLDKFRKKYRNVDMLLIDDIQFIAGKDRSQEEFFHTFNTLLDLQAQIVLISDRPACEIKNMEPRLVSRFECGLTVEVQAPQIETRMAILHKKMDDWDVKLNPDVVEFLAERIRSNIRRLEGGLVRLATYASLGSESVSIERAENLLRDILREEGSRQVSIDTIQKVVAEHFELKVSDMTSRKRPANVALARQIAMYLSRKLTRCSLMEIGDSFGGRDHGTVIHAVKKIEQKSSNESQVKATVDMLDSMLQR